MKRKWNEAGNKEHVVYLGLGSNVGDRLGYLSEVIRRLDSMTGTRVDEISSIYETEPVGYKEQPDFLNLALRLRTLFGPPDLYGETKRVEQAVGRRSSERWHPREIDIDILLFDNLIFRSQHLCIPHPEMTKRRFVLIPLSEIAGSVLHPVERTEVRYLLEHCEDQSRVIKTGYQLALR